MKLKIRRNRFLEDRTIGQLYIDEEYFCFTLEDTIREVKIHGETAIPEGRYKVTLETSPRFGPNTITINNVPGFIGIRVHGGNDQSHTEGCPIVGYRLTNDNTIAFGTTQPALRDLKDKIKTALAGGEDIEIDIVSMT